MKFAIAAIVAFAAVCSALPAQKETVSGSTFFDCTYTDPTGKKFDFTPLIAKNGSYVWRTTVHDTSTNLLIETSQLPVGNYQFFLQVCGNVDESLLPPLCHVTSPGAAFMVDITDNTCTKLGGIQAHMFSPDPFNNGAYISYFYGDVIDHITTYETRLYFVCNKDVVAQQPIFEHMKAGIYASHFKIYTKYAC